MESRKFPALDIDEIADTREAMHAYARVLGDCLKANHPKRKHWWHASLRPSLTGMTTGVVHAKIDFEIELDFRNSQLLIRSATGEAHSELLRGQPVYQLVDVISDFLVSTGISENPADHFNLGVESTRDFNGYSDEQANLIGRAFSDVAATMFRFRASFREESSPIQIWPHHFDMSMLWLSGDKIPGQDPDNEEYADKQMNFGFVLGDDSIAEPYFYITAYPLPDNLPNVVLSPGAVWQTTPFAGAVLRYASLTDTDAPADYLLELWQTLLSSARTHMLERVA